MEKGDFTNVASSIIIFTDCIPEIIDIPDDIKLVVGIGIGYSDENHQLKPS